MFDDVLFRSVLVRLVLFDERCWLSISVVMQPAIESTITREGPSCSLASVHSVGTGSGHSTIGHRSTPCYTRIVNDQSSPKDTRDEDHWLMHDALPW